MYEYKKFTIILLLQATQNLSITFFEFLSLPYPIRLNITKTIKVQNIFKVVIEIIKHKFRIYVIRLKYIVYTSYFHEVLRLLNYFVYNYIGSSIGSEGTYYFEHRCATIYYYVIITPTLVLCKCFMLYTKNNRGCKSVRAGGSAELR